MQSVGAPRSSNHSTNGITRIRAKVSRFGRLTASRLSEDARFFFLVIPHSPFLASGLALSIERTLGRRNASDARIDGRRLPQSAGQCLKRDLYYVVEVLAFDQVDVEVAPQPAGETFEEHFGKLAVPRTYLCLRQ